MMNIHEVGGWHPLLTAVLPLAPPHSPCTNYSGEEGCQHGLVPFSTTGGLGGGLVTIVGTVLACLSACGDS